ncbi:MotA/TolQ/ExbB proton channel family protein [Salipaludibacillus aurantiacus]|uniref:MotA/TolQ/ExbB proton channel family protein n=1 Tax=Salipaludibacillus aurantiacus TaxID=1601833 RepID=A0A1H9UPE1_9BACI|nr:MotA/TolQ/ExbB proton channel family protein [Salipaludibacillus aurantiacus]SES11335.1 MotA/TolQ/ExbB proton channel family protein [Salipaludibacillus aurantiacus]
MVEAVLKLFTSEQQAQAILSNQVIEFIFMVLFVSFAIACLVHLTLFSRLKRIRHFLHMSDSLDIDPLRTFKLEFDKKQQEEPVKVDTFVEQKFSSWRVFNVPVVSLIKMIQMTVSMFILIGVLGTFIGLTMSLGSIDSTGDQLVENVAAVLAGIDVAFYTSITGMGFSLIMTILLRVANTEYLLTDIMLKTESHLEENEQDPMSRLIEVSETINSSIVELRETNQQSLQNIEKAFHGFQEYTVGLQKSAEDLAKFNKGLSENLKEFTVLFKNIKKVTDGFGTAVTKLNNNFDQLFAYFSKMDKRNERMSQAFQYTYQQIEKLSTSQIKALNHFEESVEDWKTFISTMADRQEAAHGSFERMNAQSGELVTLMKENNTQFKGIFGTDVSSKLSGIQTSLRELTRDFDKLGNAIGHLPEALETINTTQAEYKHLLTDRFDDLKQFNQEFNQHIKAHARDSAEFEKQLHEASSTFEDIGSKNNQMIREINRTVSQMTDQFMQRENQLEASVEVLKETLSRYVSSLEGTLGDRLDKVSRNIGDYVMDMNGAIKKEFKQISDISEESQQRNIRVMQQAIQDLQQEFQTLNRLLHSFSQEPARQPQRIRVGTND